MSYQRKTYDEYQLHGDNGYGWEEYTSESTRREILARLREYRENQPMAYKIIKKRIKKS